MAALPPIEEIARIAATHGGRSDGAPARVELVWAKSHLQKHFAEYRLVPHGRRGEIVLVGKVYSKPRRGEAAHRLLSHLWSNGMRSGGNAVVRPVAWLPEWSFLLMEKAHGHSLHERLLEEPEEHEEACLAARWLRWLHRLRPPPFMDTGSARADLRLERFRQELAPVLEAPIRAGLRALLDRLEAGVALESEAPSVLLHGDFHPRNVFLSGSGRCTQVTAIDVDHARIGDPAWDVGYLLGQMRVAAYGRWGMDDRLDIPARAARDEYLDGVPAVEQLGFVRRIARVEALTLVESLHYDRCILRKPPSPRDEALLRTSLDVMDSAP